MIDKEIDNMVKAYVDNMPDMVLNSNGIMNWRVFFNEVAKKVAGAAYKDGINAAREQMINKACELLETINLDYYQIREGVFSTDLVKDFRKAMEA